MSLFTIVFLFGVLYTKNNKKQFISIDRCVRIIGSRFRVAMWRVTWYNYEYQKRKIFYPNNGLDIKTD